MMILDLVYTLPSTNAFILLFWKNIDDNPPPFQMAENGNISIDSHGKPWVMGAIESLGCNWWKNMDPQESDIL